jgi:hypothetical protein
LNFL